MILHSKARLAEYEMPAEGCPKDFAGYKQDCEEASAKANPYAYFFYCRSISVGRVEEGMLDRQWIVLPSETLREFYLIYLSGQSAFQKIFSEKIPKRDTALRAEEEKSDQAGKQGGFLQTNGILCPHGSIYSSQAPSRTFPHPSTGWSSSDSRNRTH